MSSQRLRKPDGAGLSAGRLRLTLLLATVAALLLVPAASASAAKIHIKFEGSGSGAVVPSPSEKEWAGVPPIKCRWNGTEVVEFEAGVPSVCDAEPYSSGETKGLKVTWEASAGSEFVEWKVTGLTPPSFCLPKATVCTVVYLSGTYTITAVFAPSAGPPSLPLTINEPGAGAGQVNCEVNSGPTLDEPCASTYPENTELKLIAVEDPGSVFEGFENGTGDAAACSTSPCGPFTLEEASELDAVFNPIPRTLTINPNPGTGGGEVKCKFNGTGSFGTCTSPQPNGTLVEVIATASGGSELTALSGTGSATGNCTLGTGSCSFTITANSSVTATFDPIPRTLTVTPAGTGGGEVKCKFNGGSAGPCTSPQPNGTTVEIIASANSGSEFKGFSAGTGSAAACSSTPCSFTITANSSVTATFDLEPTGPTNRRTLTLTKSPDPSSGTGTGSVSSKPKGVNCAAACSSATASMYENQTVVLKAKASATSTLSGWTGCESTTTISLLEGTCTVAMTKAQAVTATFGGTSKAFSPSEALSLSKGEGTGYGTVKAAGLACEAECTETTVLYQGPIGGLHPKAGKTVFLVATPAFGSTFSAWSGGCKSEPVVEGKGKECEVEMSGTKSVTATFTALPNKTLTIDKNSYGTGTGTVSSKPKGINCAATCTTQTANMPEGAVVVLTAKPATTTPPTTFVKWEGGDCEGKTELTCTVTMNTNETITAKFSGTPKALTPAETLTLTKEGSGFGTVKASGLTCEALCTSTASLYQGPIGGLHPKAGKTAVLVATSAPGSKPVVWSGDCDSNPVVEGKGEECVVAMEAAKNITATFDELE